MTEKEQLKEQISMQILEILKLMKERLDQIWAIYDRLYGNELQETEETNPEIPGVHHE